MPITYRYPRTFGCRRKRRAKNEIPNTNANKRQISGETTDTRSQLVRSGHKPLCSQPSKADYNSLQRLYFDTGIIPYSLCNLVDIGAQNRTETEITRNKPVPKVFPRLRSESPLEFYYASKPYKKPCTPPPLTVIQGVPLCDEAIKFLKKCSKRSGIPVGTFLRKYIPKELPNVLRDAEDIHRCLSAIGQINHDLR